MKIENTSNIKKIFNLHNHLIFFLYFILIVFLFTLIRNNSYYDGKRINDSIEIKKLAKNIKFSLSECLNIKTEQECIENIQQYLKKMKPFAIVKISQNNQFLINYNRTKPRHRDRKLVVIPKYLSFIKNYNYHIYIAKHSVPNIFYSVIRSMTFSIKDIYTHIRNTNIEETKKWYRYNRIYLRSKETWIYIVIAFFFLFVMKLLQSSKKMDKNLKYQPKKLVNILTNFTIDTPIKYSTHLWDFGSIKDEYGDFRGFINKIDKQCMRVIGKELKELSPKLHEKIYNFLLNENPTKSWCSKANITIGWSSLDGLEEWCNKEKNPFDFELKESIEVENQTITTFGEIITLFKKEIEIRNDSNMLENIFLAQKRKLGRAFKMELIKLKGRSFYTDVESFQNAIDRIFQEIKKRKGHKNIRVEVIEVDAESIEIVITQIGSRANRSIKEMIDEVEDGDFKMLKETLTNLCDWSIESDSENGGYRVNYLSESTKEKSEKLSETPDGFKHILRFYKK